jgi:hypothetical protein
MRANLALASQHKEDLVTRVATNLVRHVSIKQFVGVLVLSLAMRAVPRIDKVNFSVGRRRGRRVVEAHGK